MISLRVLRDREIMIITFVVDSICDHTNRATKAGRSKSQIDFYALRARGYFC